MNSPSAGLAEMTWRTSEELLERVRRQAQDHGRSLNGWVIALLPAASEPNSAGDEAQQLRERLGRAGPLEEAGSPAGRPAPDRVATARAAAGHGTSLPDIVSPGRRCWPSPTPACWSSCTPTRPARSSSERFRSS